MRVYMQRWEMISVARLGLIGVIIHQVCSGVSVGHENDVASDRAMIISSEADFIEHAPTRSKRLIRRAKHPRAKNGDTDLSAAIISLQADTLSPSTAHNVEVAEEAQAVSSRTLVAKFKWTPLEIAGLVVLGLCSMCFIALSLRCMGLIGREAFFVDARRFCGLEDAGSLEAEDWDWTQQDEAAAMIQAVLRRRRTRQNTAIRLMTTKTMTEDKAAFPEVHASDGAQSFPLDDDDGDKPMGCQSTLGSHYEALDTPGLGAFPKVRASDGAESFPLDDDDGDKPMGCQSTLDSHYEALDRVTSS